MKIEELKMTIKEADFYATVKTFGSSGYIPVPKMFVGRRVHVLVLPEDETETKN